MRPIRCISTLSLYFLRRIEDFSFFDALTNARKRHNGPEDCSMFSLEMGDFPEV